MGFILVSGSVIPGESVRVRFSRPVTGLSQPIHLQISRRPANKKSEKVLIFQKLNGHSGCH